MALAWYKGASDFKGYRAWIMKFYNPRWAEGTMEGGKQNKNKSKSWKIGELKDKEVNMAARDFDDALVCCVKNTIEDHIIDSGASFHANYCKEDLERFNLCSSKVCLADDMTLDISSVMDIVLETSFGTSWTLKDVRYILSLKRRLISVGQLDEEGYHVGFRDQQWKVTKGSLVVARKNKRGSLYMVEVHPEVIGTIINGSSSASLRSCGRYNANLQVKPLKFDNGGEYSSLPIKFCVKNGIVMLKMVSETPLQFGLHIPEEEWRGKDTSLAHLKETQVVLVDIPKNLAENDSIVSEHRLSSKITQSLGGSLDMSEGSENSGSFEDSRRSYEEDSEDGASSKRRL
ncbi:hypothetical protein Tco_0449998 [Tanacetum coccineum]